MTLYGHEVVTPMIRDDAVFSYLMYSDSPERFVWYDGKEFRSCFKVEHIRKPEHASIFFFSNQVLREKKWKRHEPGCATKLLDAWFGDPVSDEDPKQKVYSGCQVPELLMNKPGRIFYYKRPISNTKHLRLSYVLRYVTYRNGNFIESDTPDFKIDIPFDFLAEYLKTTWFEYIPEPEPKTDNLTFDEAKEAVMDDDRLTMCRATRIDAFTTVNTCLRKNDFNAMNWMLR